MGKNESLISHIQLTSAVLVKIESSLVLHIIRIRHPATIGRELKRNKGLK